MAKKKLLFVSAEKGDLKLTGDEHKVIRKIFPNNHSFVAPMREAYVAFGDLFNLFEQDKDNDESDIEVLHFSGHSGPEGLLFDADNSDSDLIGIEKFTEFISWYPNLKVIILNSCVSKYVGKKLKEISTVEVIIETTATIYERDAIHFSENFYRFLDRGDEISVAFNKVELEFEQGNIIERERGNPREVKGREIDNGKFPWRIEKKVESYEWRLFERIPSNSVPNEIRILHFYFGTKENSFAKELDISLRGVYDDINRKTSLTTKVYTSKDVLKVEGDFQKLKNFDAVLIFLTEGFVTQWKDLGIVDFCMSACNVGVINCSGNESEIYAIKEKNIEVIDDLVFPKLRGFSIKRLFNSTGSDLTSFLNETFITELKILNSKQVYTNSFVEKELDEKFAVLNFTNQVIVSDDIKKYNLFVLEGTENCAHELLVRRILTIATINTSRNHFHVFTIQEEVLKIDLFWNTLFDQVVNKSFSLNKKGDCITTIASRAETHDVVLILEYKFSDPLFFNLIDEFWSELKEALGEHVTKNRLFFFVLNKKYCSETCAWKIQPNLDNKNYASNFLKPISLLPLKDLETWYGLNLKNLHTKTPLYNTIKGELKILFKETSPMGKVVETICNKFELEDYHEKILSLNGRYHEE